jgi:protein O-mannosyl-transferase
LAQTKKLRNRRKEQAHTTAASAAKSNKLPLPEWTRVALAVSALSAFVLIAYSTSLSNGFVWDDNEQIVMNPDLRSDAPWSRLFSSDVWGHTHPNQPGHTSYYRPLQMVAYRVTSDWFGMKAQSLHVLSIVFALAAVLSAFAVYFRLTRRIAVAFAAAALFATHPMHSEAVDWISALPELGCATFFLIGFRFFLSACAPNTDTGTTEHQFSTPWQWFCLSIIAFAIALFWKETAVMFPVLVAVYVICIERGTLSTKLRSSAKFSAPFWIVLAGYLALRFRVLGFLSTSQRIWGLNDFQVALNDFHLMAMYWWKLAIPVPLNAYYLFSPIRSVFDPRAVIGFLFLLVAFAAICYGLRRAPLAAFAALWVFITLLPVMNIYALGRNAFAERYLYLPSVGFCLLAAIVASLAIRRLPKRFQLPASGVLLAGIVFWFSWETFTRNPDWHDDSTLFHQTLAVSSDAPFVHFMVAAAESENPAESESAESHYRRAIDLALNENPPDLLDLEQSDEGLASLYADRGEYAQALQVLHQWRTVSPDDRQLDAEEGLVLLKSGQWQAAEPLLNRAFRARPQDENVLNALGLLAWQYKRNLNEAKSFFVNALAVHTARDDFQASLHNNLGGVYGDLQQFSLAIEQFELATAISPENAEYHTNLAVGFAEVKRYEDAAAEAQTALRISPDYSPARAVLQQLQHR